MWDRLRRELATVGEVRHYADDLVNVTISDEHGSSMIGVRHLDDQVELTAHVRGVRHVDFGQALAVNAELTDGALCLLRGEVFVRRVLPLDRARGVAAAMRAIARLGRSLGARIGAAPAKAAAEAFRHAL